MLNTYEEKIANHLGEVKKSNMNVRTPAILDTFGSNYKTLVKGIEMKKLNMSLGKLLSNNVKNTINLNFPEPEDLPYNQVSLFSDGIDLSYFNNCQKYDFSSLPWNSRFIISEQSNSILKYKAEEFFDFFSKTILDKKHQIYRFFDLVSFVTAEGQTNVNMNPNKMTKKEYMEKYQSLLSSALRYSEINEKDVISCNFALGVIESSFMCSMCNKINDFRYVRTSINKEQISTESKLS